MSNPWYRRYAGTSSHPMMAEIALIANCSRSVAIAVWECILEGCCSNGDATLHVTPRRVAATIVEPVELIERVFDALIEVGKVKDGVVVAWNERQFVSDSSTERSRKSRERAKNNAATPSNGDATVMQRCATPPDTDTDTEVIRLDLAREAEVARPKAKPVDQFQVLETQLREAAGWEREPHPNLCVMGPVAAVLMAGVDLDLDLLPAAKAHGPKLASRTSWKYIIQAAISNRDNRISASANASKPINLNAGISYAKPSKSNSIVDSFRGVDAQIERMERELAALESSAA